MSDPDPDRTPIFGAVVVLIIAVALAVTCFIVDYQERHWAERERENLRKVYEARGVE